MTITSKICGLTHFDDIDLVNRSGADMVGFVFHAPSPRHVMPDAAAALAARCAPHIERVAVLVDPDDDAVENALAAVSPHRLQLHGNESPARVAEIAARTGRPIIKAFCISSAADIEAAADYADVADRFLFDAAKAGSGEAFDRTLLKAYDGDTAWILSGGLTPENVADAVAETGATAVDVSSGVEASPGRKDPARVAAFIAAIDDRARTGT